MRDFLDPLIIASVVTFGIYYIQEILIPYAEKIQYFEEVCEKKGGIVIYSNKKERLCLDKKFIINI